MANKPWRKCVRVIILKGDHVLLGRRFDDQGKIAAFDFPGGGVEDGDSIERTVIKECLEEVGLGVKNVTELDVVTRVEYTDDYSNEERRKKYAGNEDIWCTAEYLIQNTQLHGKEGDAMKYSWEPLDRVFRLLESQDQDEFNLARLEALRAVKGYLEVISMENFDVPGVNNLGVFGVW